MKHDSFKTYLHWGLTAFGVVALSILFFFSLFKVGALVHFFQTLLGILMPFVYGLAMAYLLTPVFNWLHARFAPALQKHVKNPRRTARAAKFLSTTLSVLLALLLLLLLLLLGKKRVHFETNGGTALEDVSVRRGDVIGEVMTPMKPGAVFGGWFADKALTKPWDTQHDAVQSSMTLYARWL